MEDGSGKPRRVLLKLSGEILAGPGGKGFHRDTIGAVAEVLVKAVSRGVELGVVAGGGNFVRAGNSPPFPEHRPTTWACLPR